MHTESVARRSWRGCTLRPHVSWSRPADRPTCSKRSCGWPSRPVSPALLHLGPMAAPTPAAPRGAEPVLPHQPHRLAATLTRVGDVELVAHDLCTSTSVMGATRNVLTVYELDLDMEKDPQPKLDYAVRLDAVAAGQRDDHDVDLESADRTDEGELARWVDQRRQGDRVAVRRHAGRPLRRGEPHHHE